MATARDACPAAEPARAKDRYPQRRGATARVNVIDDCAERWMCQRIARHPPDQDVHAHPSRKALTGGDRLSTPAPGANAALPPRAGTSGHRVGAAGQLIWLWATPSVWLPSWPWPPATSKKPNAPPGCAGISWREEDGNRRPPIDVTISYKTLRAWGNSLTRGDSNGEGLRAFRHPAHDVTD